MDPYAMDGRQPCRSFRCLFSADSALFLPVHHIFLPPSLLDDQPHPAESPHSPIYTIYRGH